MRGPTTEWILNLKSGRERQNNVLPWKREADWRRGDQEEEEEGGVCYRGRCQKNSKRSLAARASLSLLILRRCCILGTLYSGLLFLININNVNCAWGERGEREERRERIWPKLAKECRYTLSAELRARPLIHAAD